MEIEEQVTMEGQEKPKKKRIVKYLLNIVLFLALIYLTFTVLLQNEDIDEIYRIIGNSKVEFILLGILFMVVYYWCEARNMRRTLKALGEECSMFHAMKYVFIGAFFSAITPAASGGQPLQIIAMHRDNIKVASSTVALVLNLLSIQVITISMELLSVIFLHQYMDGGIIALFVVGVILNSMALSLLLIGMCSQKLSTGLVNLAAKILKLLKIKNYEAKEKSMQEALANYHESAQFIRQNQTILWKQFLTTLVEQVAYYSIPFCVLYAFQLPPQNYVLMVALQSIVFGTVSGIPSPGAVGVSEGAFQSIFKPIFTEEFINSAMILHRGISFYFPVALCAIVVLVWMWKKPKKTNT